MQPRRFPVQIYYEDTDHSGVVYVVGRDGRYLGFAPPGTSAERLMTLLRPHLAATPQS